MEADDESLATTEALEIGIDSALLLVTVFSPVRIRGLVSLL